MYYISDFCCACLKNDKTLVNIKNKQVEPDTLVNKLKLCVSEVEWSEIETLMCDPCIEKLNSAFEFKQQCLKSAQALQSYVWQLNASSQSSKAASNISISLSHNEVKQEIVDEYVRITKELEESQRQLYLRVKPTTQLFPVNHPPPPNVGTNNTNENPTVPPPPFPNIFFNFIPANTIRYPCGSNGNSSLLLNNINAPPLRPPRPPPIPPPRLCDQNMFFNMNNVLHKMVRISPNVVDHPPRPFMQHPLPQMSRLPPPLRIPMPSSSATKPVDDVNISQLLTESNAEEVSIEIDPMCFDYTPDWEAPVLLDGSKDCDDSINTNKLQPKPNITHKYIPNIPVAPLTKLAELNNTVHARLKPKNTEPTNLEDKIIEFLNIDHFMALKTDKAKPVACEQCGQLCDSIRSLHFHTNQIHKGKFPYSCKECLTVYVLSSEYKSHIKKQHPLSGSDGFPNDVITLKDLSLSNEALLFPQSILFKPEEAISEMIPVENEEIGEYKCTECSEIFNKLNALARHKFKKHSQTGKKKYFIKGMKNAKCDICNREFSTQSYLQLHIKLHDRKNNSKLKVLNKDKYKAEIQSEENTETEEKVELSDDTSKAESTDETADVPTGSIEEKEDRDDEQKSVEVERSKSPKGIKITINLKNIKQSIKDLLDDESHQNSFSDSEMPMEVDGDGDVDEDGIDEFETSSLVNGDTNSAELPNSLQLPPIQDDFKSTTDNISLNCDEITEDGAELLPTEQDSQHSPLTNKYKIVDGKPQCSFCLKLFSRKHDLKRHINNIHLKAIQYICHLCNTQFYEAFHLTRHLRQHNSFVRCAICLRDFSILRDLKTHIMTAHDDSAPIQCGTCDEVFSRIKHLQKHMYIHDKDIFYKCHICNLELKESRELSRHLVEHSGMYSCNICQSTYSTDYELCNHMKNHSLDTINERKYECVICHNRYKKRRYLLNHMNNSHSAEKHNNYDVTTHFRISESV